MAQLIPQNFFKGSTRRINMVSFRDRPICPCGDFPWKGYYWERQPPKNYDFEQNYWQQPVDPDGNKRTPMQERKKKLKEHKEVLKFINNLSPGSILDVGCGLGFTLSGVNNNWDKYGTEVSDIAAKFAEKYARIYKNNLLEYNFPRYFFRAVLMLHTLRYVNKPRQHISEIYRLLYPGGVFIISEADYDSGCARKFKKKYRLLHDKAATNLFSTHSLIKLLEDEGFTILKIEHPFFDTEHFTKENLLRLFNGNKTSPPFYGNTVTIYAIKD